MPTLHDLVQGSDAWHQFRLEHFGASEAAAMLGLSSKVKRSELLRMKHTGDAMEFSDWVQKNILDNGHVVEALARPIAEKIIGDELYPATYSDGKLSASCDGLTMDGLTAWEHKQWNEQLAESVRNGVLPDEQKTQCQQVMMVTGAERLLFMVSDGTETACAHMWVVPDQKWRKRIQQGWAQFAEDIASYQHVETAPQPVAAPIESLPALLVQVEGRVLSTNLEPFKEKARAFIAAIKTDLATDQDFADADKMTKFLKDGEERLETVKQQALGQTASIYELFSTIDHLREEMRAKRLELDRLVEARKKSIRAEILAAGEAAVRAYIDGLNKRIGRPYMPDRKWADFAAVMRGKKTVASLRDAVDTEVSGMKIAADELADLIQMNMASLTELAGDHKFLFADAAQLVLKGNDDLVAVIKTRIADHKAAEAAKEERERAARQAAEALAAQAGIETPAAVAAINQAQPLKPVAVAPAGHARKSRPTDDEIIDALWLHFGGDRADIITWLSGMDLRAASKRMAKDSTACK